MAADTSLMSITHFPAISGPIVLSTSTWKRVNIPDGASVVTIKAETGGSVRGYLAYEGSGLDDGSTVTLATDKRLDIDLSSGPSVPFGQFCRAGYILLAAHAGTPTVHVHVSRGTVIYE